MFCVPNALTDCGTGLSYVPAKRDGTEYGKPSCVAVRHVRRDALDVVKKLEKDHKISKDDHDRFSGDIQKATDAGISEIDQMLGAKEKEILTV